MASTIVSNHGSFVNLSEGVEMWQYGVKVKSGGLHFIPSAEGRNKRGEVTSFSPAARRRMREALLVSDLRVPSYRFGITLTVPWHGERTSETDSIFREVWNRFTVSFKRKYPKWAAIFRVELQQRGMPHVHAVVFCPETDAIFRGVTFWQTVHDEVFALWLRAVGADNMRGGNLEAFVKHGVSVDYIRSHGAMMRYICDHATKSKQAQLGYKGKQWGYLNRKNFQTLPPVRFDGLIGHALVIFNRQLQRLCRFRVKDDASPFGCKLSHRVRRGTYYVNLATAQRIAAWARDF